MENCLDDNTMGMPFEVESRMRKNNLLRQPVIFSYTYTKGYSGKTIEDLVLGEKYRNPI